MNLRQTMPLTAAWIDEMRAAFGKETIDTAIRNGMRGGSDFYASEGGQEIGNRAPERGTVVSLADMVIGNPFNQGKK